MTQDQLNTLLEDFSNSPFFEFEAYGVSFEEAAIPMLNFMLYSNLVEAQEVSIGIQEFKGKSEAIITYDEYDSEKSLLLKLSGKENFEIELSYYNSEGDQITHNYKLNNQDKDNLPQGLVNIMQEVKLKKKTMVISGNSLR